MQALLVLHFEVSLAKFPDLVVKLNLWVSIDLFFKKPKLSAVCKQHFKICNISIHGGEVWACGHNAC